MKAKRKFPPGGWKWVLAALAIGACVLVGRVMPVGEWLQQFNGWVTRLGWWGPAAYAAMYALATVLLAPGAALSLGGGAVFGVLQGFAVVWTGAMLGACGSFLIARYVARDAVARRFGRNEKFVAVDRAVALQGAKIVFLLRLSPVFPFNALNYLLGLTAVSFRSYALATAIGIVPGGLLYVYLGYATRAGLEAATGGGSDVNVWRHVLLGIGLLATLVVTIYVTRLARRALREVSSSP